MSMHPSKEELSGFLLGKLPAAATEAVAKHLERCSPCQETIVGLETSQDTLLHKLREATPPSPSVAASSAKSSDPKPVRASTPATGDASFTSAFAPATSVGKSPAAPLPTREQFVSALGASGLIDEEEWNRLQTSAAIAQAADGATLARALVQQGTLTKYQASLLYQGKTKGLVFGEYVVLELLGSGGMGQVFKARHRSMDRIVALKVLARAAVNSPDAVKRFQREVKAAAKLIHPNIVTAFDAGQQDGVHFLVMEYVPGSDLSALVKREGALPVDKVICYITQAARGLAFAHAKGVVHRDIKPGNLLVDGEGTVRILDMGLARLDGDAASKAAGEGLTQTGQVMGTVDYMAPEQAFDTSTADAKADMYSLGCTLYRLLTGQNMFGGETLVQKILAHREQPIPSLVAACPNVPPQLDAIYRRMVAKQPEERPTMGELVAELETLSKGEPTSTFVSESLAIGVAPNVVRVVKPTAAGTGRKPPSRKLLAAGAAGFLMLCLGVWVVVRDRDNNEVGRMQIPDGGSAVIQAAIADKPSATLSEGNVPNPPAAAQKDGTTRETDVVIIGNTHALGWNLAGRAAMSKYLSAWTIENRAVADRKAADLIGEAERLANDQKRPRVIVVQLCGRVMKSSQDAARAIRDYAEGVDRLRKLFPKAIIVLTSGIRQESSAGSVENTPAAVLEFNDGISRLADNRAVYFINLDEFFHGPDGATRASLIVGHSITPKGYERWAEAMQPLLAKVLSRSDAQISGAPTSVASASSEFALHFNGKSRVELPQLQVEQLKSYCFEAMVTPRKNDPDVTIRGIISWPVDDVNLEQYGLIIPSLNDKSCWKAKVGPTSPAQTGNGTVRWDEPIHVALSNDGGNLTLFLDGKPVKSSAPFPLTLSKLHLALGTGFCGEMRQVRISSTARYEGEFVPEKQLLADNDTLVLYRFDEGTGDVLQDASGHHYDAKIVGATWIRNDAMSAQGPSAIREQIVERTTKSVVDLLPQLQPAIHTDAKWEFVDGAMQATIINKSRYDYLAFDYSAPTEYDLTVEIERLELGNGMGIRLGLANEESEFEVGVDIGALRNCDIRTVDEGRSTVQSRVRGPLLEVGKKQTVVVEVRRTGVALFLDGQKQCGYEGPLTRLSRDPAVRAKFPRFFLLSYVDARFHRVELRAYADDSAIPNDSTRGMNDSPLNVVPGATGYIDLLGLVELGSRSYGSWQREGSAVVATQDSKAPTIRHIPFTDSPTEYDLVAKWETIGDDGTITFGLPSDSIRFDVVADMSDLVQLHLDVVEGKRLTSEPSQDIAAGTEIELRLAVRRTGVTASLNGKEVLAYQGSLSKLSRGTDPPTQPFFIRVAGAARFHKFELISVGAPADGGLGQDSKNPPLAIAPFDSVQARAHQEAWAKHLGVPVEYTNSIGMKFMLIPPGRFQMGSSEQQIEVATPPNSDGTTQRVIRRESPQHEVTITKPLYVSVAETTVGDFRRFVEATKFETEVAKNGSGNGIVKGASAELYWLNPGYKVMDQLPVTQVSWNDAQAYCRWLNEAVDSTAHTDHLARTLNARLPTEAEWEHFCRAGTTAQYSFGDDANLFEEYGWFTPAPGNGPRPVMVKKPNPFGLFDLHGNVAEWCEDWFGETWYERSPSVDPVYTSVAGSRVIRGGDYSWGSGKRHSRSASRITRNPTLGFDGVGFRVVLEIPLNGAAVQPTTAEPTSAAPALRQPTQIVD